MPPDEAGRLLEGVEPGHWALVLTPFLTGVRPEELLALRPQDIDADNELILVHQRATPAGGRPDKPGVLKPGLKERRRLVREEPQVRGRWTLFPCVLHPGRTGVAIPVPGDENVIALNRSDFLYATRRTRGSRGEQLTNEQKLRGSIWSQRNLYRDVIEPAREAAIDFTLYDARHTFESTVMAAGLPLAEVAAYSGHVYFQGLRFRVARREFVARKPVSDFRRLSGEFAAGRALADPANIGRARQPAEPEDSAPKPPQTEARPVGA